MDLLVTGSLAAIISGRGSAPFLKCFAKTSNSKIIGKALGKELELSLIEVIDPYFKKVTYLDFDAIRESLLQIIFDKFSKCNIISLDPIFVCNDDFAIKKSRTNKLYINSFLLDCSVISPFEDDNLFNIGVSSRNYLAPRWGARKNNENLLVILQKIRNNVVKNKDIVLVDEVIFSGETVCRVKELASEVGLNISAVIAGVAEKKGIAFLESLGLSVYSPLVFDAECNKDTVEARDFFLVPQGGRGAVDKNLICRIPRFYPCSRLDSRFSISFSDNINLSSKILDLNITLYKHVNRFASSKISNFDLQEIFHGVNSDRRRKPQEIKSLLLQMRQNINDSRS
jgi:hypothetical protein